MKTIILVGCGKTKLDHAAPAKDLYTGQLFQLARRYAEQNGDEWGILSAKHGLLDPEKVIEPYEQRLPHKAVERQMWVESMSHRIRSRWCADAYKKGKPDGHGSHYIDWAPEKLWKVSKVRFVVLAGKDYLEAMNVEGVAIPHKAPLEGMQIGERLQWLKQQVDPVWDVGLPDRSGMAAFTVLIRDLRDPEETVKRGSGTDTTGWKKLNDLTPLEWCARIVELLRDGVPRTFNRITVELTGRTADVCAGKNPEDGLWLAVERGHIEWANGAPIRFRIRRVTRHPRGKMAADDRQPGPASSAPVGPADRQHQEVEVPIARVG